MDEPLALIKKPRKEPEVLQEKTKSPATTQIQVIDQNNDQQKSFKGHSLLGYHSVWAVGTLHVGALAPG